RLDPCIHLLLQAKCLRHGFDNEIGGCHAFTAQIRDQTIEGITNPAVVVTANLCVEVAGALDCASNRLRLHVGEAHREPMPCAPGCDVATHGAGANYVDACASPRAACEAFQVVAQEEDAYQVLRCLGDKQLRKG